MSQNFFKHLRLNLANAITIEDIFPFFAPGNLNGWSLTTKSI